MDWLKLFSSKTSSKDVAKERLKLILIHDRQDLSPQMLEMMKNDILAVISKYVEIDDTEADVKLTKPEEMDGFPPALIASIPIKNIRNF